MEHILSDRHLTLFLTGRIDSKNAAGIEKELQAECAACSPDELTLDLEQLTYISSAGLRMVLRLRKAYPSLTMVNASVEVYDVLDMTGFIQMIPVTKAYRRLSVAGCTQIGQGANGKVYRLDPDTIIKVYRNPDSLPDIHRERELARKAFILGIPTAIPYDVVRVGESYGTVFELLNARSLADLLREDPDNLEECARKSVELLKSLHSTELQPGDMPDEKTVVLGWADFLRDYLPASQYARLRALIEAVPEDHHMMHGDFHVKNVMVQNGEALLIDMDTLCLGHPVFEFASIYLAYQGYGETDHDRIFQFFGLPYETCIKLMRQIFWYYFDLKDEAAYQTILDKVRVIGYTRMMRRTIRRQGDTEAGKELIAHCAAQLTDLLARVDSLIL